MRVAHGPKFCFAFRSLSLNYQLNSRSGYDDTDEQYIRECGFGVQ